MEAASPVEEPEPAEPAAPAPEETPVARTEAAPKRTPVVSAGKQNERRLVARAVVMRLLLWMNYPLRFLPDQARVIVEWIALSLVFWVPIVWLIALLLVGR